MEPSFWSWEKGEASRRHTFDHFVAMEPSFWSWEKQVAATAVDMREAGRNGAQLLELGKAPLDAEWVRGHTTVAMEPSFWSWEKLAPHRGPFSLNTSSQWSPAFGAGKRPSELRVFTRVIESQWSPAFGAGKRPPSAHQPRRSLAVAMEPSFWSWEKIRAAAHALGRRGVAMEPSFWSWEKSLNSGAGSSVAAGRNGAQLLELGKELAIFSPTDYQCCTSLRAAEVLGQMSRVVAP